MNYRLSREIYGNTPWAVDGETFASLINLLKDLRNGVVIDSSGDKLNNHYLFDTKSAVKILTDTWELNEDAEGNDLVYVINLNGVITKSGGMSSYGMKELSAKMLRFDADSRIKGGIIVTDSGGGSTMGMELMQYTLTQLKKPVVGLIERTGMAASAAYGILSHTKYIFAEDKNSTVGSIGTMLSFSGYADKTIDGDGAKHVVVYASASTQKNKAYEEALNNDNYELLINDVLDPVNERFLASVKKNRPNVKASELDGSTYNAVDVVGSLIDEIGGFEAAVNKVIELSSVTDLNINSNNNNKNKTTAMTAQELKSQHPAVYQEIFGAGSIAGINAERDRVGSWLAHASTNLEEVTKGIEGGGKITATAREKFLVQASSAKKLEVLKSESPVDVDAPASTEKKELTESEAFYAEVAKNIE